MYVGSSQDFSEINWKKVIPRVPSFLRKPREPRGLHVVGCRCIVVHCLWRLQWTNEAGKSPRKMEVYSWEKTTTTDGNFQPCSIEAISHIYPSLSWLYIYINPSYVSIHLKNIHPFQISGWASSQVYFRGSSSTDPESGVTAVKPRRCSSGWCPLTTAPHQAIACDSLNHDDWDVVQTYSEQIEMYSRLHHFLKFGWLSMSHKVGYDSNVSTQNGCFRAQGHPPISAIRGLVICHKGSKEARRGAVGRNAQEVVTHVPMKPGHYRKAWKKHPLPSCFTPVGIKKPI